MPLSIASIHRRCSQQGECRLWNGGLSRNGYPYVHDDEAYAGGRNRMVSARSAVWRLRFGPVPAGKVVAMTCHNKLCLAHQHMEAMTMREAQLHAAANGAYSSLKRRVAAVANARKHSTLNREKVQHIHRSIAAGVTREALAIELGVHPRTIGQVCNGHRWRETLAPNASVFSIAQST